jgi:long-chain acyl-CoA synthetase
MNIAQILWTSAFLFPERPLAYFKDQSIKYGEFLDKISRGGNGLRKLGVQPGDRVVVYASNNIDWLICEFSIWAAGGVLVPINDKYTVGETKYIIDHSGAGIVLIDNGTKEKMKDIVKDLKRDIKVVTTGGANFDGRIELEAVINSNDPLRLPVFRDGEDPAAIYYTSGTTGKPKGCVLKHNGIAWGTASFTQCWFEPGEILLIPMPLPFVLASYEEVIPCIQAGGAMVLLESFSPKRAMEAIEKHKVTLMMGVTTMYSMMLNFTEADNYDISSLRYVVCAGAVLSTELAKAFQDRFDVPIVDLWGLSEALCMVGWDCSNGISTTQGSGGTFFPEAEMRIVDENDNELPIGESGEVLLRGPGLMKGYYKDTETTAEVMRGGWMHTGDLGRIDEDRCVYIVGRKKDLIKRGGINVFPSEIENVLYGHPKVAEAAVVGMPDKLFDEEVRAVIVLKEGSNATEEEIKSYCAERLTEYKCPKCVEFWDDLPKGATGKILKRKVQEMPVRQG